MRTAVVPWLRSLFLSRSRLQLENAVLRHQLAIYQRSINRPKLRDRDRLLWSLLSRATSRWRDWLYIAKPRTVVQWQRRRIREYWARLSRPRRRGRPSVHPAIRALIRQMSQANVLWGAPRIAGELGMLGIEIAESTVAKYMVTQPRPASPTWSAFLRSHLREVISVDFFIVPTVRRQILFVFLVLSNERRRVLHFNVTTNPTAEWTARQLVEAFAWTRAPRYLLRDHDGIYGYAFQRQVEALGMAEVRSGKGKPWQNPYVERLIGTIRRECLDHVIVLGERHLMHVLREYLAYYHGYRTHLSLGMDAPDGRDVQVDGAVRAVPHLDGLHHHYERAA
jgi:transposase InsO family protein